MKYTGWELHNFDQAKLYRSYQFSLIKNQIKGNILEVGPGNCIYLRKDIIVPIQKKQKVLLGSISSI